MVKLGRCDVIEQIQIGDETLLKFSGVPLGEACSIVLRGATEQIIGEAERSLHDALCVLTSTVKETKTVYGGGISFNFIFFLNCTSAIKNSKYSGGSNTERVRNSDGP